MASLRSFVAVRNPRAIVYTPKVRRLLTPVCIINSVILYRSGEGFQGAGSGDSRFLSPPSDHIAR